LHPMVSAFGLLLEVRNDDLSRLAFHRVREAVLESFAVSKFTAPIVRASYEKRSRFP
jgi:hypothetical protein